MNIALLRLLDKYVFGAMIIIFFWLKYLFSFKKKQLLKTPRKILVIRLWALGSSLLTFNMIKTLKDHYGESLSLDLLASSRNIGVYKNQGYFNKMYNILNWRDLLNLFLKFKSYDIVLDTEEYFHISSILTFWLGKVGIGYKDLPLRGISYNIAIKYNDKQHSLITCMDLVKPLGIEFQTPERMEQFVFQSKDKIKVDEFIGKLNYKTLICLHAGGAETAPERFWSNQNWIMLINLLLESHKDMIIIMSGTNFEKSAIQEILSGIELKHKDKVIDICGKFSLGEFAYLLTKVDVMVVNDTGPMHLAACMGTNTVGLFGPNLPVRFGPYPLTKNIALYKGDGTTYIDVHLGKFEKCPKEIIDSITPIEVEQAVEKFISVEKSL